MEYIPTQYYVPSQYFVPSKEIKRLCFVDCENCGKNIDTFYEYPVMQDTFVLLFYATGHLGFWRKIPGENQERFRGVLAQTSGRNAADAAMILHATRLHMILPNDVVFYLVSRDHIFAEIAIQLSLQGRIVEYLPNINIGYYLYLQKNILLPETTFEKTLRFVRDIFSVKTYNHDTVCFLRTFLEEKNIESTYWTHGMLLTELLRRNGRNPQKKLNEINKDFHFELNLILEKLRKFLARICSQVSISIIGDLLKEDKEFIEKYYGKLSIFLSNEEVKKVIQAEMHCRLDGVLVLKRYKHFEHVLKCYTVNSTIDLDK